MATSSDRRPIRRLRSKSDTPYLSGRLQFNLRAAIVPRVVLRCFKSAWDIRRKNTVCFDERMRSVSSMAASSVTMVT
uniref:Uncharacterized protein n=1 Tax=Knipowitschia caucasica TaxID=637954 RepID=A0AAV2JPX2_KNICA